MAESCAFNRQATGGSLRPSLSDSSLRLRLRDTAQIRGDKGGKSLIESMNNAPSPDAFFSTCSKDRSHPDRYTGQEKSARPKTGQRQV